MGDINATLYVDEIIVTVSTGPFNTVKPTSHKCQVTPGSSEGFTTYGGGIMFNGTGRTTTRQETRYTDFLSGTAQGYTILKAWDGKLSPHGPQSFIATITTSNPVHTIYYYKDDIETKWESGEIVNDKGKTPVKFRFDTTWFGCSLGQARINYKSGNTSGTVYNSTTTVDIPIESKTQTIEVWTEHYLNGVWKKHGSSVTITINSSKYWLGGTVTFSIENVDKEIPILSSRAVTIDTTKLTGYDSSACKYTFTIRNTSKTPSVVSLGNVQKTIPASGSQSWELDSVSSSIVFRTSGITHGITLSLSQYNISLSSTNAIEVLTYDGVDAQFHLNQYEGQVSVTEYVATNDSNYQGSTEGLKYTWEFYKGVKPLVKDIEYEVTEGTIESRNIKFKLNVVGDITIKLTVSSTKSGVRSDTISKSVKSASIYIIDLPSNERFAIGLWYNDGGVYSVGLATRMNDVRFDNLKFKSSISKIGTCTFKIYFAEKIQNVMRINTHVVIYDNLIPIWTGIITEITRMNINTYDKYVESKVYEVKCEESIKELSYENIPQEIVGVNTNTISKIVFGDSTTRGILPREVVGESSEESGVNYSISLDTTSVLTALNTLSSQLGWRYRVRPEPIEGGKCQISKSGNNLIITTDFSSRKIKYEIKAGDFILIHFNYRTSIELQHHNLYGFCYVDSVEPTGEYDATVTCSKYYLNFTEIPTWNYFTMISVSNRNYVIDYKISYYQPYVPISYKINDKLRDVTDMENTKVKFGEVSVYGIGYSGEMISSTMTNWTINNPNYTIDKSCRISMSYDSNVDTVIKGKENTNEENVTTYYFTLNLNGWAFPHPNIISGHNPYIFYKDEDKKIQRLALNVLPNSVNRKIDHANNKKTSVVVYTTDEKEAKIIESIVPLTNVIFDMCFVVSGSEIKTPINFLPDAGKNIYIGDSKVRLVSKSQLTDKSVQIVYSWYKEDGTLIEDRIPHGHHTDVLVLDASGSLFDGHDKSNPVTGSPRQLYPNTSITVQGPEGYSAMEMERLSCRYMQYGTNYSVEGKAKTNLLFFRRTDFYTSTERILYVGDRVEVQTKTKTGYDKESYELQGYEVNADTFEVDISFGMPFVEIGNIIYNMNSNATMSIVPTDSHSISEEDYLT